MTREKKRYETQADKLQDQMRKMIDTRIGLANGADIYKNAFKLTHKVIDDSGENRLYKFIPEHELMDMQKKGFEDNFETIIQEKEILKECLAEMQSSLNTTMVTLISQL